MTGIERLRELADKYAELGKDHTTIDVVTSGMAMLFSSIANQIGREHAEDCYGMVIDHGTVSRVASDMERHVLGHEGMEDSPVARWARELREALGGRDEEEVTDVATIRKDAMEAYEWVREHGGLDAVKRRWECLSYYADPVPRACMDRRLASRQRQIDESHAALRRRNERIAEPEARLNDFQKTQKAGVSLTSHSDESPAPKVLDADGVEIRVGDTVYYVDGRKQKVNTVARLTDGLVQFGRINEAGYVTYCEGACISPNQLTHERPESKCRDCAHWQKDPTADNMGVCWFLYHEHEGQDCYAARLGECGACEEFVRRAKKLAGVGE